MTLLTGTFQRADGSPLDGTIAFTPTPTALVNPTADEIVIPQPVVAFLVNGTFSVELVATDDAAYSPTDWVYTVEERFYQGRTYTIQVPDGAAVDLADLVPPASWAGADFSIVMTGSISLLSSFDGGEDEGQVGQFDSTSRLNLYSYQRADVGSYGENIRRYLMRKDAKSMDTWEFPEDGYDGSRNPLGDFKPVVWAGAHWEANDHLSNHKHWSVETPDSTGAIQTRFEVRWGDPSVDNAIAGLDKTIIATNLADLVVRCSNGQQLRLSSPAGVSAKVIEFNHDYEGTTQYRRWQVRATEETESGANAGTNFQFARYDDAGTFIDTPVVMSRSTGNVTLAGGFIARRSTAAVSSLSLNTTSLGSGIGVIAIGNANTVPSGTPTAGGVLYVEAGALKFKGSSGTVSTIAPA